MIKIISDIEKSEYNPKNYNLEGCWLLIIYYKKL